MPEKPLLLEVTLNEEERHALAQFLKRTGYTDVLAKTNGGTDEMEAYAMVSAVSALQHSLAQHGYAPR